MSARREGEQNPFWKRVQIVMNVQMGQMTVTEAARELGVSRAYYYQLEEEMLRAALGAVTPQKPGPKPPVIDPEITAVADQLKDVEREKELLQIKVKHLEEIQREMITRGIGVLREKKVPPGAVARRHRKKVHGPVQADGALEGRGTPGPGRSGPGSLPGDGTSPRDPMEMEERDRRKAGPETSGGRS